MVTTAATMKAISSPRAHAALVSAGTAGVTPYAANGAGAGHSPAAPGDPPARGAPQLVQKVSSGVRGAPQAAQKAGGAAARAYPHAPQKRAPSRWEAPQSGHELIIGCDHPAAGLGRRTLPTRASIVKRAAVAALPGTDQTSYLSHVPRRGGAGHDHRSGAAGGAD